MQADDFFNSLILRLKPKVLGLEEKDLIKRFVGLTISNGYYISNESTDVIMQWDATARNHLVVVNALRDSMAAGVHSIIDDASIRCLYNYLVHATQEQNRFVTKIRCTFKEIVGLQCVIYGIWKEFASNKDPVVVEGFEKDIVLGFWAHVTQ